MARGLRSGDVWHRSWGVAGAGVVLLQPQVHSAATPPQSAIAPCVRSAALGNPGLGASVSARPVLGSSSPCHWPWANHVTSLSLSFTVWKIVTFPPNRRLFLVRSRPRVGAWPTPARTGSPVHGPGGSAGTGGRSRPPASVRLREHTGGRSCRTTQFISCPAPPPNPGCAEPRSPGGTQGQRELGGGRMWSLAGQWAGAAPGRGLGLHTCPCT